LPFSVDTHGDVRAKRIAVGHTAPPGSSSVVGGRHETKKKKKKKKKKNKARNRHESGAPDCFTVGFGQSRRTGTFDRWPPRGLLGHLDIGSAVIGT